jgi:hypothetical protein
VALVSFQVTPMIASQDELQDSRSGSAAAALVVQTPVTQPSSNVTDATGGASYTVPLPSGRQAPPIQVMNNSRLANFVVAHSEYSSPLGRRNVLTGLVAEDVPADQPVEQFIVEQLAVDESAPPPAPQPTPSETANRGMLSSSPRQ